MNNVNSPFEIANIYYTIGTSYLEKNYGFIKIYNSDNYEKTLECYNKALEIWLAALGENNDNQEDKYGFYIDDDEPFIDKIVYFGMRFDCIYHSITMQFPITCENNDNLSEIYTKIGNMYTAMCNYAKAIEYYKKASFSADTISCAVYFNYIGNILYIGEYDYNRALEYYNEALKIMLSTTGENNVYTAAIYNNIGGVYSTKNYDKALEYYDKALKILCSVFSESDINVAAVHYNIGCTYYYMKDFGNALRHLKTSYKMLLYVFGREDTYTSDCCEIIKSIKYRRLKWILLIFAAISAVLALIFIRKC